MQNTRQGFTLIEMSIVLVVIGLVVGGVMAGEELVKASKIRKVISEIEQLNTAVMTFRGKYDCIPGDCANATTFWGTAAWPLCSFYNSSAPLIVGGPTCNGDGDGHIDSTKTAVGQEQMWFWHHLLNAGLLSLTPPPQLGEYLTSAVPISLNDAAVPGMNIPMSNTGLGAWSSLYWNSTLITQTLGNCGWWDSGFQGNCWSQGNNLEFLGGIWAFGNGGLSPGGLSPAMALAIDTKLDDGHADTGKIRAGQATGCVYSTSGTPVCGFIYLADW